jgi:hypothetical protein
MGPSVGRQPTPPTNSRTLRAFHPPDSARQSRGRLISIMLSIPFAFASLRRARKLVDKPALVAGTLFVQFQGRDNHKNISILAVDVCGPDARPPGERVAKGFRHRTSLLSRVGLRRIGARAVVLCHDFVVTIETSRRESNRKKEEERQGPFGPCRGVSPRKLPSGWWRLSSRPWLQLGLRRPSSRHP